MSSPWSLREARAATTLGGSLQSQTVSPKQALAFVKKERLTLRRAVAALREHYGPPEPIPTADPFELVLWDNVAYLAPPPRRREAFELLNGLRVLVRLRLVREGASYSKTYTAARAVGDEIAGDVRGAQQAHLLLHHHGQTLCRRHEPQCAWCPLVGICAYGRRAARRRRARRPSVRA